MTALPSVPTLHGTLVRLEALSFHHAADLGDAAEEDRCNYGFTFVPRRGEVVDYISAHLDRQERGEMVPFAQVRQHDGRAVGCTSYFDFRAMPDGSDLAAVMVGWTWLSASAQRSGINRDAKLLLLSHAFDQLGVMRVDFSTDARNERSRQALAGLGATFEGVLRNWSRSHVPGEEGQLRDCAIFSVVAAEWPAVKAALASRLNTPLHPSRDRQPR